MRDQQLHMLESPARYDASPAPVTCLGMEFENDAARRAYFTGQLRVKLNDPDFRKIEGFPLGDDEDILALSDPPYYTACPNPWIADFIKAWEAQKPAPPADVPYHREPFAADVSEGKTHPIYKAHSYHTKVPHLAIVPYLLHYTEPGDIVLDGFAGSGMTGVAAHWCGEATPDYRVQFEAHWQAEGYPPPVWGARYCVLNDLAPAAGFIAANYNLPFDVPAFSAAAQQLLAEAEQELGWMYETLHTDGVTKARIEYTVWSEVFICPNCAGEVVFLEEALDPETKGVKDMFPCPHCQAELTKRNVERRFEAGLDPKSGDIWKRASFRPVLIRYKIGKTSYEKTPDQSDFDVLDQIAQLSLPPEIPAARFPIEQMYHGSRIAPKGFTHIHHFFLPRAAQSLGFLWRQAQQHPDLRLRHMLMYVVEQAFWNISICNSYRPTGFSQVSQYIKGIYYIPSQHAETSPWYILAGKVERLGKAFTAFKPQCHTVLQGTGSTTTLDSLPDGSIDYIFTDPPFGENIFYADLNYLVEAWYGVVTNAKPEAIVDQAKKKGLPEYQELMRRCFAEYCRVLKPGRWITIVFHNSRNAVWNAIQEALQQVGFVVADVRTMDKQQGSYRQVTSMATKQDLVISAYKPNGGLEERFQLAAGTEDGMWDFVRTHLRNLPAFVQKGRKSEIIVERKEFMLFDRMVAFHVQRGVMIPLSAPEFYTGLERRFPKRDGMFFLPEQVVEYDIKRMSVEEVEQLTLFVLDEASAIQWLRQLLAPKPQTFQEIHPQFLREIAGWHKHETALELSTLLVQNFLCYEGVGPVPEQLQSYFTRHFKEFRNLPNDDPMLQLKARDRWYVPDPNKAADLEKLRERTLLKEFERYKAAERKLKVFRLEAVRAGFKTCWQAKDYATIIAVAEKIPHTVLEEDPKLLMWYDQAVTRKEANERMKLL